MQATITTEDEGYREIEAFCSAEGGLATFRGVLTLFRAQ